MEWFKILLMVYLGLGVIEFIAKAGGWNPNTKPYQHATDAVIVTLFFVGVWLWL